MVEAPAWSALFLGLFLFVCSFGELRRPGLWRGMIEEIGASPALQMLTGLIELTMGIAVYLCNRAAPAPASGPPDWLAVLMMVLGGFMIIEALVITAFTDRLLPLWRCALGSGARGWALVGLIAGAALIAASLIRFL